MATTQPTEDTPLLRSPTGTAPRPTTSDSKASTPSIKTRISTALNRTGQHLKRWQALYVIVTFLTLIDFLGFLGELTKVRVYEGVLCRQYYVERNSSLFDDDGNVPEKYCKNTDIQSELAQIRGALSFLDEIITIFLVVPFGILGDIYGRKLIAVISMGGMVLADTWVLFVVFMWRTLPAKSIIASSAFKLVGGGNNVVVAMFFALAADVTPPEYRCVLS
jgi:hypothetical protein